MNTVSQKTQIGHIKNWLKSGAINIFGLPFAGKDTHARQLAHLLDGVMIGSGDILRSNEAPTHVQEHIAKGFLAPTEEFINIILPYFARPEFKGKSLILSSVGRWHGEEAGVLEATAESGHPLLVVIHLNITVEEMKRRWEAAQQLKDRGKRDDDAEHILTTRLDEFENKTKPVIEFYRDQGMLIEIDGLQSKEAVLQEILNKLAQHATANN